MAAVTLTRLSSKGQVVIPEQLRKNLGLNEGEMFAITGKQDTLVLKKVVVPSSRELFENVHRWGVEFAKKKKLREEDLQAAIIRSR